MKNYILPKKKIKKFFSEFAGLSMSNYQLGFKKNFAGVDCIISRHLFVSMQKNHARVYFRGGKRYEITSDFEKETYTS